MFETESFKNQLQETIADEAGRQRLAQFNTSIIAYLQSLATTNEPPLMESEMRKTASLRRGIPDALASTRELVKEASARAIAAGRTTMTLEDMSAAYQAKFCQVWPFCR